MSESSIIHWLGKTQYLLILENILHVQRIENSDVSGNGNQRKVTGIKKINNSQLFIMQSQESKLKIKQLAQKVRDKIKHSVLSFSFMDICKIYKEISVHVGYLLQFMKLDQPQHSQLSLCINSCVQSLKILVESTEYQKYTHRFPLFQKVLRSYQLLTCVKPQAVQMEKVISATQNNQKSHFYRTFGHDAIEPSEIAFLKSDRVSSFFSDLREQGVILQDPSCVCCCQVFIKNFKIFNNNPLISVVVQLTEKKGFDEMIFESYVNAVCNKRGGTILIGMERKGQSLIATGIKFNTIEEIQKRQSQIRMAILRIKPICRFYIQRVLVHTNYAVPSKIAEEYMRICFRISIFPYEASKINYSEISNKGYHRIYQVFKFDLQKRPYKIVSTPETESSSFESLYTMMHQKYRQATVMVSSHENIKCYPPYPHYSRIFNQYVSQGCPVENVESVEAEQIYQREQCNHDDPKFKYKHTSLLIVGSVKGERIIQDFQKVLTKKKEIFEISKPFEKSFREGVRSIWMISHQINFIELKNYHKGLEVKNILKQNSLTMMPVYQTLEIERSEFFANKEHIQKKFFARYGQLFDTQATETWNANKKQKSIVYLHFSCVSKAIYAYLIFEQLQLKPYFTKDGNNKDCIC